MTKTEQTLLNRLIEEIRTHPHQAEVLQLMQEQLIDDQCTNVQHISLQN